MELLQCRSKPKMPYEVILGDNVQFLEFFSGDRGKGGHNLCHALHNGNVQLLISLVGIQRFRRDSSNQYFKE